MVHLLPLLALWLCLGAQPLQAEEPSPEQAAAVLAQDVLPALGARAQAAEARIQGAEDLFAGRAPLAGAFPELADAPLADPAFLRGRLSALDQAARQRAVERVAPPPAGLNERDQRRWTEARDAACEAEDRADALERRLLNAAMAALDKAPALTEPRTAELQATWQAALDKARETLTEGAEDPEAAAAARAAGDAKAGLRRVQRAAILAVAVAGNTELIEIVEADLSAVAADGLHPLSRAAALDRLSRAAPLLPDALREQAEGALTAATFARLNDEIAALEAQTTAPAQSMLTPGGGQIAALEKQLAQARAALAQSPEPAALAPEADPLATLRHRRDALAHQRATARVEQLTEAVRLAQEAEAAKGTTSAEAAEGLAQEARQKEERARREASEAVAHEEKVVAELREKLANRHARAAGLLEQEANRREASLARLQALRDQLDAELTAAGNTIEQARELGNLSNRERLLADSHQQLTHTVEELRGVATDHMDQLHRFAAERRQVEADLAQEHGIPASNAALAQQWQEAAVSLQDALASREANVTQELDTARSWLEEAKQERRVVRDLMDRDPVELLGPDGRTELLAELGELSMELRSRVRELVVSIQAMPERATRLGVLAAFVFRSVELLVLVAVWVFSRRRAASWVHSGLRWATASEVLIDREEVLTLSRPVGRLARALVDVLAAFILYRGLADGWPTLAFGALILLCVAVYRTAEHAVVLVMASPDDRRAALVLVSPELRALAVLTVQALLGWALARRVGGYLSLDLLSLDRVHDLVMSLAALALVGVIGWLLLRWGPLFRLALAFDEDSNRLTTWLCQDDGGQALALLRSALSLGVLLVRFTSRAAGRIADRQDQLSWLNALLARRRLRGEGPADLELLTPEARARMEAVDLPAPRAAPLQDLQRALATWQAERRAGMVAVTGDWGSGKTRLLDDFIEAAGKTLPVRRLQACGSLHSPDVALHWLSALFPELGDRAPTPKALIEVARAAPPSLLVLDDLHQLFLRSVDGYEAIQAVLGILRGTCDHHLWVTSFHAPTWGYLELMGSQMGLDGYRTRVHLAPLSAEELGAWLLERARLAGFEASFEGLASTGRLGGSPRLALQRATAAFWRLLADASQGNPVVAERLWLSALGHVAGNPDETRLDVRLFETAPLDRVSTLADPELFVLTGLVVHDGLDIGRLSEVLNLAPGRVRAACEHLLGLEVIQPDPEGFIICVPWRPLVVKLLRQKHFLRKGAA
ncbi:MAG: hypothetical protein H6739_00715 [Alphaproteobacteria bacterium]|nr:hypothetical protein [Alphaproteobacteria bacterium]